MSWGRVLRRSLTMKRFFKNIILALTTAAVLLVVWHLFWGRLVPFSGMFIGFKDVGSEQVIVFFHDDREEARAVAALARSLLPEAALTLGILRGRTVEIVLCKTEEEYRRFTGSSTRFVTIDGRIFVSPRAMADAKSGVIHLRAYLAHELAHAILAQNRSVTALLRFPAWLDEGLATSAAGQIGLDGYFDEDAVCAWVREGRAVTPSDYVRHGSHAASIAALPENDRYHFLYSEFALFVRDLMEQGGRGRFLGYLEEVNKGADWREAFVRTYSAAPDEALAEVLARICAEDSAKAKPHGAKKGRFPGL